MNNTSKLIVFLLDGQRYGIPITVIEKVLRAVEITTVPNALNAMLGIINVHGDILPVLNIRYFLGLNQRIIKSTDRLAILQINSRLWIFVFDDVLGITEYDDKDIAPTEQFSPEKTDYIHGILQHGSNLIFLLNVENILSHQDIRLIENVAIKGKTTL